MAGKVTLRDQLMFPSDYVSAVELKGRDVAVTIATVTMENMKMRGGKVARKPVLTFKEAKKKFALNVTNADSIAIMYGTKAENWPGKRITLYPTTTKFGRETVDCIRIREVRAKSASGDIPFGDPEPHEEEQPFTDDAFTHPTDENLKIDPADASDPAPPDEAPGQVLPQLPNYTRWPNFALAMEESAKAQKIDPDIFDQAMAVFKMMPASKLPELVEAARAGKVDWKQRAIVG